MKNLWKRLSVGLSGLLVLCMLICTPITSFAATPKLSFDGNGGKVTTTLISSSVGESYGALPFATRTGYTFAGWYTSEAGGTRVIYSDLATGAQTVYAHWTKTAVSGVPTLTTKYKSNALYVTCTDSANPAGTYQIQFSYSSSFDSHKNVYTTNSVGCQPYSFGRGSYWHVRARSVGTDSAGNVIYGRWSSSVSKKIKSYNYAGSVTLSAVKQKCRVANRAAEIVEGITNSSMNDFDKVKASHDYLVLTTTYDSSTSDVYALPASDHTAYGALFNQKAVCDGYAYAMQLMLRCLNIPCQFVKGSVSSTSSAGHAWNRVKVGGYWYWLDVTWDDPVVTGFGGNYICYTYFLVNDGALSQDHRWNAGTYGHCTRTTSAAQNKSLYQEYLYSNSNELPDLIDSQSGTYRFAKKCSGTSEQSAMQQEVLKALGSALSGKIRYQLVTEERNGYTMLWVSCK